MYVAIRKKDNEIIIATNKEAICKFLDVSRMTIYRNLGNNYKYDCKKYTIWQDVDIIKGKQKGLFR